MKTIRPQVTAYLGALSPRDRNALLLLGLFLAGVFLWLAVWQPVEKARLAAMTSYQKASDDLTWMRAHAEEARHLNQAGPAESGGSPGGTILATATETAALYRIAINHAEPAEDGSLRLSLESVEFSRFLPWLESLQREHSVKASQVTIEKIAEAPGRVTATLTLRPIY